MLWDPLDALTDEQKFCLYRGFQALLAIKNHMRVIPPEYFRRCDCTRWNRNDWTRHVTDIEGSFKDPKGLLKELKGRLLNSTQICTHMDGCWSDEFRLKINRLLEDLDGGLAKFFAKSQ
jgi:hypothetical protein